MKNPEFFHLQIKNSHNHTLENIARSFAKISQETKATVFKIYEDKKSPSQAKKIMEKNLDPLQTINRRIFPRNNDYYRLYYRWLVGRFGEQNGEEMWAKLDEMTKNYTGKCSFTSNFIIKVKFNHSVT